MKTKRVLWRLSLFKCFVCQESGNVISFVSKYKNIPYKKAIIFLADKYNIEYDKNILKVSVQDEKKERFNEANRQASELFNTNLRQKENKEIYDYLLSRKIDDKTLNEFSIGLSFKNNKLLKIMTNENDLFGKDRDKKLIWSKSDLIDFSLIGLDDNGKYWDFFIDRVIIPINDRFGNIVGFSGRDLKKDSSVKYLNSKSSELFKKNSLLFNMDKALKNKDSSIYIMEGYFDVISSYKSGIKNVVGTMGTSFNINHVNLIKKNNFKNVILCMDNDNAGRSANYEIGKLLVENNLNVYVVDFDNTQEKDMNDILVKYSEEKVKEVLSNYITFIEYLIETKLDNNPIDKKIMNVEFIIDFIGKYGNKSLVTIYAEKIASKTGFDINDIKNNINSSFGFSERIKDIKYLDLLKKSKVDYSNNKKILNLELILLRNMIFNVDTIELYLRYVNFLELFISESYYKILANLIISIYNETSQIDENIILEKYKNVLDDDVFYEKFYNSYINYRDLIKKNNLKQQDIKKQSLDLIMNILKNKRRTFLKMKLDPNDKTIKRIEGDIQEIKTIINEQKNNE